MKTTLIKDLYGEIERLKAGKTTAQFDNALEMKNWNLFVIIMCNILLSEVYASREKSGVYLPKERYYQEEMERKV